MVAHIKQSLAKGIVLAAVIVPLVGTVYAIVQLWNRAVNWEDIALLGVGYVVAALGIIIGYHRMMTHHGFDAPAPVRATVLIMGCTALQGPPITWCATHLKHHAMSDVEGDPHSPVHGFFHSHVGWLFGNEPIEEVYRRPFESDPVARWVSRTFFVWATLGFVVPFLIGGWSGLLWGGLVRVFLLHHVTWSVNSVCHMFGQRDFDTSDRSRNQWIVGLLGLGEGWHNNHHAFPRSARHGLRWWQIDVAGYVIWGMEKARLVRNVWRVPKADVRTRLQRAKVRAAAAATTARTRAGEAAAAAKAKAGGVAHSAKGRAAKAADAVSHKAGGAVERAADAMEPAVEAEPL